MTKAARVNSTLRLTASSRRKTSPNVRSPAPPARPAVDVDELPDIYCLKLDGDCLEPLIPDGATVALKKSASFGVGDVVCIWFRPEVLAPGSCQGWIKRVTLNVPPWVKFPYREHPESEVSALIMVEQLNPPINYSLKCKNILAIHKAVGFSPGDVEIGGSISSGDLLPIGEEK
jgi:hypothetical protein